MYIKELKLLCLLSMSSVMFACNNNAATTQSVETNNNVTPNDEKPTVKNISQQEFITLQKDSNTLVLDVRTPSEIAEGYIKGTQLFIDINGSNFQDELNKLDKSKTYLVYCRSGARSSRAASAMIDAGFKVVYNLTGGIMGWTGETVK